ncbi:MAG: hypothetical protein FJ098_11680, partial [Deltaproteobacteria bacterium]|nr:hypothetical protein [Deltaproteobacteria bacterium]
MASTTTDTPAPRASRGGFLRRHWVAFVASAAVLAILTSAAVLWWIPSRVERVVRELEHRAGDLLALEIRHSAAVLDGTRRLVVTDLVAAAEGDAPDAPLFSCRRMEVDFDPFALRDGVPTLLGVRLEGVQVHLLAEPGGNDNFRATARGVLDLLRRTGGPAEGGERSRLVRLLSQLPPVEATDVSVVAHLERGAEDEGTRSLVRIAWRRGTVSAANPSATGVEKRLQIHARFEDEDAGGTVRLDAELDRGAGTASATFRTERGLPVVLGPASLRLDGATWVRGRMLDVEAGLLRVPVPDVTALERAAEALMGDAAAAKAVGERLRAGMRRASELQERLRDMAGKAREGLVSLGYTPSVVDRVVTGWTGGLTSLVHGLREPLRRDEVSFDRVRLSRTRDGEQALEVWMFHLLQAGDAELWCRARRDLDTGDVAATWRVGLVPLGL